MSYRYLTPSDHFSSISWREQVDEIMLMSVLQSWIFKALAHWNFNLQVDITVWLVILTQSQSVLLLNVMYLAKEQPIQQSNLPMWSPLLSSHLHWKVTFFLSCHRKFIWIEPLLKSHLSYKTTFSLSQGWPFNTGLTVHVLNNFGGLPDWDSSPRSNTSNASALTHNIAESVQK